MFVKVCLLVLLATVVMSAPTDEALTEEASTAGTPTEEAPTDTVPTTEAAPEKLTIDEQWAKFKTEHQIKYKSPEEEQKRFEIFKDNVKGIEEHNKRYEAGETTYTQGINEFTDLTQEEFAKIYLHPVSPNDDLDKKGSLVGSH